MKTTHIHGNGPLILRMAVASVLALGTALTCAQTPSVAPADEDPDPALANMAPVTAQDRKYVATDDSYNQPPDPSPDDSADSGAVIPSSFQLGPDAPGDDSLWNPGYWGLSNVGYFWVPGFWRPAPFYGALWTPPYWGFYRGRYVFHPGYWGTHIGFYGGINYGFGYIGTGYFGGYWSGHTFYYNRAVTNVRDTIPSVYSRAVVYRGVHYGKKTAHRISFNGGRGVSAQPRPAERAAAREPHMAPTFLQANRAAMACRKAQSYFNQNRGIVPVPRPMPTRPPLAVMVRPEGNAGMATTTTAMTNSGYSPTASLGVAVVARARPAETLEDARQEERTSAARRQENMERSRADMESRQNQGTSAYSTRTYSTTSTVTSTTHDVEATRINRPPPAPAPPAEMPRSNVNTERVFRPEEAVRTQPEEHLGEEKHPVEAEHPESGTVYAVPHEPNSVPHRTEPPKEPEPPKPVPQRPAPLTPRPAPVQPHAASH